MNTLSRISLLCGFWTLPLVTLWRTCVIRLSASLWVSIIALVYREKNPMVLEPETPSRAETRILMLTCCVQRTVVKLEVTMVLTFLVPVWLTILRMACSLLLQMTAPIARQAPMFVVCVAVMTPVRLLSAKPVVDVECTPSPLMLKQIELVLVRTVVVSDLHDFMGVTTLTLECCTLAPVLH